MNNIDEMSKKINSYVNKQLMVGVDVSIALTDTTCVFQRISGVRLRNNDQQTKKVCGSIVIPSFITHIIEPGLSNNQFDKIIFQGRVELIETRSITGSTVKNILLIRCNTIRTYAIKNCNINELIIDANTIQPRAIKDNVISRLIIEDITGCLDEGISTCEIKDIIIKDASRVGDSSIAYCDIERVNIRISSDDDINRIFMGCNISELRIWGLYREGLKEIIKGGFYQVKTIKFMGGEM